MNSDVNYQVLEHQHIFTPKRYFRQCHASTICRLPDGSFGVAWFGGSHEKAPDVAIWFSKKTNKGWSEPERLQMIRTSLAGIRYCSHRKIRSFCFIK